jgi:hypothetical protein
LIEKAFIACTPFTPVDGSNAKTRLAAPLHERQFIGLSRDAAAKFTRGLGFGLDNRARSFAPPHVIPAVSRDLPCLSAMPVSDPSTAAKQAGIKVRL